MTILTRSGRAFSIVGGIALTLVVMGLTLPHNAHASYYDEGNYGEETYGDPVLNSAPPVITNITPTTFSATTTVSISLMTDKPASCRYASVPGSDFTIMTPFLATGSTTHTTPLDVIPNTPYVYYAKCQDALLNTSPDTQIMLSVAATSTTTAPSTLSQGLALEYNFDAGTVSSTSVMDVSGHGHTGSLSTITGTTTGYSSDALPFTASSSIDIGTTTLGLTTSYTISLWLNQASFNTNSGFNQIFARGTNTYPLDILTVPSHLVREIDRTSKTYYLNPSNGLTPGRWTNIIATYDDGVRKFYTNGVLTGSDTIPGTLSWPTTSRFTIGRLSATVADGFIGSLDDVRVYTRAITDQEAASLANGGV